MIPRLRIWSLAFLAAGATGGVHRSALALPSSLTLQRQVTPEPETRTAAQQKIDSQLLYEIYRARGIAKQKHVPPGPTGVRIDEKRRALVDVRADVTPALEKSIRQLGGTIVDTSRAHHSIVAWVPLLKIESLAGKSSVRAISPAPEATTVKQA